MLVVSKSVAWHHESDHQYIQVALLVSSSSLTEPKMLTVKIARRYDGNAKIVEIPPGPPVLSPLVAEVYGIDYPGRIEIAKQVRAAFAATDDIVDIDDSVEYPSTKFAAVRALPGSFRRMTRAMNSRILGVISGIYRLVPTVSER